MSNEQIIFSAARSFLKEKGFSNADSLSSFLVAQSKHETGGYSSPLFKGYKNAFGYKRYIGSSYQSGNASKSPEGDYYAAYNSVKDSALELAAWINRRKSSFSTVTTLEQYNRAMVLNQYYTDTSGNYLAGLKRWFVENPVKASVGVGSIALVVAGGLILITAFND